MKLKTRVFGDINIEDEKIINFEKGIIGFPDLKKFTLIHDEEKQEKASIIWMQSLDEPAFAMPVMDPLLIKENYNPSVEEEFLKALGNLESENTLVLVTVTVPNNIEQISVNLKAPIIINAEERKAVQVIVEDEDVKYEIYKILQEQKEKAGE